MKLSFSPTLCPKSVLPKALELARATGYPAIELHCIQTASSPYHPDTSVRMIRESLDEANITLSGLNIRNLGPTEFDHPGLEGTVRQVDWDVNLARALRLKAANLRSGTRSDEARENLIQGVNTILSDTPDVTLNLGNQKGTCLVRLFGFH